MVLRDVDNDNDDDGENVGDGRGSNRADEFWLLDIDVS